MGILYTDMNDWILLLIAVTAGSIISLSGGLYLLYGKRGAKKLQRYAVSFAAGALLAASFFDLLPEAFAHGEPRAVSMAILIAFLAFFLLERGLNWFHHHHEHEDKKGRKEKHRTTALIIIGDTLHNFIDGLAIGAAFLVSPAVGVVTTFAVAAHEIPQEIGDFGLLLARGMKKKMVVIVNLLSALITIVGAGLVYGFGGSLQLPESILLASIAGFFIYIAASDIIPTIHHESEKRYANLQSVVLIAGVIFVGITTTFAHSFIAHPGHDEVNTMQQDLQHDDHNHVHETDHEHSHDHDHEPSHDHDH